MTTEHALATAGHLIGTVAIMNAHHIRAFHAGDDTAIERCVVQPGHDFLALMAHAQACAYEVTGVGPDERCEHGWSGPWNSRPCGCGR